MTHGNEAEKYYCPYDNCGYTAPTERQVRSHISLADHGEHTGVNGYSIEVDVPGSDGETYSYMDKNKVSLEDTTLADITDEVTVGKQIILKIAYNNPDKAYTEIREIGTNEEIELSYDVVRDVIQTHIEAVPTEENPITENEQDSGEVNDATATRSQTLNSTSLNPLKASPDLELGSTKRSSDSQTNDTSETQPGVASTHESTTAQGDFPYDTEAVPDYWSEQRQKIIATHQELDDPTAADVHTELTDRLGYDIDISVVYNVLNAWGKNEYDELTETQKRAIDAMIDQDEAETLADVADRFDIPEGTLKYVRYTYTHILSAEGGPVPGIN